MCGCLCAVFTSRPSQQNSRHSLTMGDNSNWNTIEFFLNCLKLVIRINFFELLESNLELKEIEFYINYKLVIRSLRK